MKVAILEEVGYKWALLGTSLSRNQDPDNMSKVCDGLASKDGGHNKFLEFMGVYLDIQAPRYWWQEFDTYRIGVSKLSESTMYTITKRYLTPDDFESCIYTGALDHLNNLIAGYRGALKDGSIKRTIFRFIKNNLPEGFLQRRIIATNYKALRGMYHQRKNHKLDEWRYFCNYLLVNLKHPNYLLEDECTSQVE